MRAQHETDWNLIPATHGDIEQVRARCRRLVQRRAAMSAGMAAIPIPGVELVSDMRLFSLLIDDINREFGLTPAQLERLQPRFKLLAYEAAASVGGAMVGKFVTRELAQRLVRRRGGAMLARQAARLVPLAGQAASAAIGFLAFRQIGYQHVDACARVARELLPARPAA